MVFNNFLNELEIKNNFIMWLILNVKFVKKKKIKKLNVFY